MSEIENLGGVLHEIRSAVRGDEGTTALVEGLVAGMPEVPAGPDVDDALAAMARSRPPLELAYERLPVLAALGQARPKRFGSRGRKRDVLVRALRPVTPDGSRGRAEAMLDLLCDGVDRAADAQDLRCSLVRRGLAERLLDVAIESRSATVRSRAGDVRASLGRSATIPCLEMTHLHPLLEPDGWSALSDGRITLTRCDERERETVGNETIEYTEYLEEFRVSTRMKLTPRLRFARPRRDVVPPGQPDWLEYRLANEDKQSPGEIVTVDQGSIVVYETGHGVRVETTKRVRLTPPFDAPSLALQAEVLGYPAAFEQMVREAVHVAAGQAA